MNVENTTIQGLINAFLIIIPVGAVARVLYCAVSMIHDDEEREKNKRRAKNAIYFGIVAEASTAIIQIAYHYFG